MTYRFRYMLPGLAQDVHHMSREFLARMEDGFASLEGWRERARAAYDEVEAHEAATPEESEADAAPDGAPPQYDAVRARVEQGDYTWDDVMSAEAQDPDARAVHVWLDSRVDVLRRAWREMERGAGADEAVAAAERDVERARKGRN
jgi:hypothetical protein